jgi:hypothetical protein
VQGQVLEQARSELSKIEKTGASGPAIQPSGRGEVDGGISNSDGLANMDPIHSAIMEAQGRRQASQGALGMLQSRLV